MRVGPRVQISLVEVHAEIYAHLVSKMQLTMEKINIQNT